MLKSVFRLNPDLKGDNVGSLPLWVYCLVFTIDCRTFLYYNSIMSFMLCCGFFANEINLSAAMQSIMLYMFLLFIGVKDELLRLIKALYSVFLSSSESKRPVCKCSLLYTTRYHPIRYRKANSKCKVDKTQKNGGIV